MFRTMAATILISIAILLQYFVGCSEENVTNPTTNVHDGTPVAARLTMKATDRDAYPIPSGDVIICHDTVYVIDTVWLTDTVIVTPPLTGEWLKFSAYQATIEFVKQNYPERESDRFSGIGTYCDYGAGTPAGRAGFGFVDNGDSTFVTGGYTFEYVFGAGGYVWGAAQNQPTENTYSYGCTLRLGSGGDWTLLNVSLGPCGTYIRDTRHD